jgi:hypothetical protein
MLVMERFRSRKLEVGKIQIQPEQRKIDRIVRTEYGVLGMLCSIRCLRKRGKHRGFGSWDAHESVAQCPVPTSERALSIV